MIQEANPRRVSTKLVGCEGVDVEERDFYHIFNAFQTLTAARWFVKGVIEKIHGGVEVSLQRDVFVPIIYLRSCLFVDWIRNEH